MLAELTVSLPPHPDRSVVFLLRRSPGRGEVAVPTLETLEWTREEIIAEMERIAQRRRQMSAAEVVRRFHAGMLEAPGELADLLALGDLLDPEDAYSTWV